MGHRGKGQRLDKQANGKNYNRGTGHRQKGHRQKQQS